MKKSCHHRPASRRKQTAGACSKEEADPEHLTISTSAHSQRLWSTEYTLS